MSEIAKYIPIIIVSFILFDALLVYSWFRGAGPFLKRPKQQGPAVVARKRVIVVSRVANDGTGHALYLVTFRFPDGSEKAFDMGETKPGRKAYDSLYEGDIGTLSYIEIEDIKLKYADKNQRHKGRRLIGFVKAPEYGGAKIRLGGIPSAALFIMTVVMLTVVPISVIGFLVFMSR